MVAARILCPVSYTHLDVYKRQEQAFQSAFLRGLSRRDGSHRCVNLEWCSNARNHGGLNVVDLRYVFHARCVLAGSHDCGCVPLDVQRFCVRFLVANGRKCVERRRRRIWRVA